MNNERAGGDPYYDPDLEEEDRENHAEIVRMLGEEGYTKDMMPRFSLIARKGKANLNDILEPEEMQESPTFVVKKA